MQRRCSHLLILGLSIYMCPLWVLSSVVQLLRQFCAFTCGVWKVKIYMESYRSVWNLSLSLVWPASACIIYLPIYYISAVKTHNKQTGKSCTGKLLTIHLSSPKSAFCNSALSGNVTSPGTGTMKKEQWTSSSSSLFCCSTASPPPGQCPAGLEIKQKSHRNICPKAYMVFLHSTGSMLSLQHYQCSIPFHFLA